MTATARAERLIIEEPDPATARAAATTGYGLADQCPVARLGRRFVVIQDRDRDLGEAPPAGHLANLECDRQMRQLMAAADMISAQVEWMHAESLEGVYFQALHLGSLARELTATELTGLDRDRVRDQFDRLMHLTLTGMERLGGFDGAQYGKAHKTLHMIEFETVLSIL
jgi:hypothetical protein